MVGHAVDAARVADPDRTYDLDAASDTTVSGDADQLRQVFDNLFSNARIHTPAEHHRRHECPAPRTAGSSPS